MFRLRRRIPIGTATSSALHVLAAAALLMATHHRFAVVRPMHMAGTSQGQRMLLSYSLGSPLASQASSIVQASSADKVKPKPTPSPVRSPAHSVAPLSEIGPGTSGDSALGDGDVRIALPQVHPRPQPDLTVLPHGTAGDVVVDVTIDDTGKVTTTTLVKGLGAPVDTAVMQVLQGWTFTPATRNGQNIASEQEILIHYERG